MFAKKKKEIKRKVAAELKGHNFTEEDVKIRLATDRGIHYIYTRKALRIYKPGHTVTYQPLDDIQVGPLSN